MATPGYDGFPIGDGILVEGRLRYGIRTHDGHSGVNIYSEGGLETFNGFKGPKGWVQLEVRCSNTTRLVGGRPGQYCVKGPRREVCNKVALVALWVRLDEIPPLVLLS